MRLVGSASCFMPLDQMSSSVRWPRVFRVAGAYPGVTAAEIAAVPGCAEPADPGSWAFEFPDEHSALFGVIAVPGSDLIDSLEDPIILIASSTTLGIPLAHESEVLVIVDRADQDFDDRKFFAFTAPDGSIVIRRFDEDPDMDIAGRVAIIKLPFDVRRMAKSGTWLEEDEDIF